MSIRSGSSRDSAPSATSLPGAAYLSRGRQGPVHIEEAERGAGGSHISNLRSLLTRPVGTRNSARNFRVRLLNRRACREGENSHRLLNAWDLRQSYCLDHNSQDAMRTTLTLTSEYAHAYTEFPRAGGVYFRQQLRSSW
jgi:hypothetical protein